MNLKKDAKIFTENGREVGKLTRFVLDPRTNRVISLVFEHGFLPKTEYVLPMSLVDQVDEQGIHLKKLPVEDVTGLTLFKVDNYLITNENAVLDRGYISDTMINAYYYYPRAEFGAREMMGPNNPEMYNPPADAPDPSLLGQAAEGNPPVIKEQDQNIPKGTVAMKEGAKVVSKDSKQVGSVEKVIINPQANMATHLLITKGLFNKEKKLVPMEWVDQVDEDEVFLGVDEAFLNKLPDYPESNDLPAD